MKVAEMAGNQPASCLFRCLCPRQVLPAGETTP